MIPWGVSGRLSGPRRRFSAAPHTMKTKDFALNVTGTNAVCPVGETTGRDNINTGAIPVLSCEGACIRGEIARLADNRVAKTPGFARGCHGELFAAPDSQMAGWVKQAPQVVVIDGCHLRCHGRIVENLVGPGRLRSFDALSRYRKYGEVFEIDGVPEPERRAVAEDVATWVNEQLSAPAGAASAGYATNPTSPAKHSCCGG